jgi:hypothetical protein
MALLLVTLIHFPVRVPAGIPFAAQKESSAAE